MIISKLFTIRVEKFQMAWKLFSVSCRSRTCGKCIKNDAGNFFLLVIVFESSMKISLTNYNWGSFLEIPSTPFPVPLGTIIRFSRPVKQDAVWSTKTFFLMTPLFFFFRFCFENNENLTLAREEEKNPTQQIPICHMNTFTQKETCDRFFFPSETAWWLP